MLWNRDHLYYLHIPHGNFYLSILVNNIFGEFRSFWRKKNLRLGWNGAHSVAMEEKMAKCDLSRSRLIFIPEEHLLEAEDVATPDLGDLHFTSEFGRSSAVRGGQSWWWWWVWSLPHGKRRTIMMMMRILIPCGDHMAVMTVMRMVIILIRLSGKTFTLKFTFSLFTW